MVHEDYKELLAAAALGSLDRAETIALESHLQDCTECRVEHRQLEQTAALLALNAPPQEPSKNFRSELLLKIRASATSDRAANVTHMPVRQSYHAERWIKIAAAVTITALGIGLFLLWRQNVRSRAELARLHEQIEQTRLELARQREAAAIVTSPGARLTQLNGTPMAPTAHAMLVYDQNGRAVLMAKNLPPPPPGRAYQLWFIVGGNKMPGKLFKPSSVGDGMLTDQIPDSARTNAVFAITLEPENGVTTPTGDMYLVSQT